MNNALAKKSLDGFNATAFNDLGLYIHIPFCVQRCHFCAFYLVRQEERNVERFITDLKKEIVLWASRDDVSSRTLSSIYFGGGTPTVLSVNQLNDILECVSSQWSLDSQVEVTIESTPESLSLKTITALKKSGVTRLSLGVQSFDPQEREMLGLHSGIQSVREAIRAAHTVGMENVNVDLMYGIPEQTFSSWQDTLVQTLELHPRHLSCYALSIEEGTRFFRQWKKGLVYACDAEKEHQFQGLADDYASQSGLSRYEISNWAHPGAACRHNLRYWQGQDYLGLGPSAQSYVGGRRWGNVPDLLRYSNQLAQGQFPVEEVEQLSPKQQRKERIIFGLRQVEGVPAEWVHSLEDEEEWSRSMSKLLSEGLVSQIGNRFRLTARGRELADTVGETLW